jgi:hypothetical protein
MARREFLRRCGRWSAGVVLAAVGLHTVRADETEEFVSPGFPRPPLDGACLTPVSATEKTLAAMVDAVVPGAGSDPLGEPGALEGCAMNILLDEYYPFKEYAGLIVALLDKMATDAHGKLFADCPVEARVATLVEAQKLMPVLRLAFRAIRSAFFGGAYNGIGLDYVGYAGPNLGYRHIPEASFRRPVCAEASETGWLP